VASAAAGDRLLTYAAAIAFQSLIALIPLTLLGLGLLGAFGLESTWTNSIAPAIENRVTAPVFDAIDFTVRRVLNHGTAGLIAFAALLSLWYLSAGMRAVMEARVLVVVVAPRAVHNGVGHVVLGLGRWLVALLLLALAVAPLVRYGPAEHPQPRWASVGSALIIGGWVAATLIFRAIVSVLNFKSPSGSLTGLITLNGYLFTSALIFLVGVEVDELLRKGSTKAAATRRRRR